MDDVKNYILFPSYNQGLALEVILKKERIKYTVVPSPRELSACCGIAMVYLKEDEEKIRSLIEENKILIDGLYSLEKKYKNYYLGEE